MRDSIGCTVPWIPEEFNDVPVCTEPEKRKEAFELYQKNRRNQRDICPSPCLFTNMYFSPAVTGINDADKVHNKSTIKF